MITAAAYILKVPAHRREILLEDYGGGWSMAAGVTSKLWEIADIIALLDQEISN